MVMVARGGRCRGGVVVKKKKEERSGEEKMKEGGIGVQMAVELAFPTFNRGGWRGWFCRLERLSYNIGERILGRSKPSHRVAWMGSALIGRNDNLLPGNKSRNPLSDLNPTRLK